MARGESSNLPRPEPSEGFALTFRIAPQKFSGILFMSKNPQDFSERANEIVKAMLSATKDTKKLVPIYDFTGTMWWPKHIPYENVRVLAAKNLREKEGWDDSIFDDVDPTYINTEKLSEILPNLQTWADSNPEGGLQQLPYLCWRFGIFEIKNLTQAEELKRKFENKTFDEQREFVQKIAVLIEAKIKKMLEKMPKKK